MDIVDCRLVFAQLLINFCLGFIYNDLVLINILCDFLFKGLLVFYDTCNLFH